MINIQRNRRPKNEGSVLLKPDSAFDFIDNTHKFKTVSTIKISYRLKPKFNFFMLEKVFGIKLFTRMKEVNLKFEDAVVYYDDQPKKKAIIMMSLKDRGEWKKISNHDANIILTGFASYLRPYPLLIILPPENILKIE